MGAAMIDEYGTDEKRCGISIRLVKEPDPHERILYYTGNSFVTNEPTFGLNPEPVIATDRPYVNVGTIGHCDYMGSRPEYLTPLQQAIRDANNGRQ